MASDARRYLGAFFGLVFGGMVLVAAFDHLVDPYDMRVSARDGQDVQKPAVGEYAKISKPFAVAALRPAGLVLGTSRSAHAIDPRHPAWPAGSRPVFNFAQVGTTMRELRRALEHAIATGPPRTVVLELDYHTFNVNRTVSPDFDDALLRRDANDRLRPALRRAMLLVSADTLSAAVALLYAPQPAAADYEPDGRTNDRLYARKLARYGGHHALFVKSERSQYIEPFFAAPPPRRVRYRHDDGTPAMEDFVTIVALARAHGIDLRCYLPPLHARQREVFRALGLAPEIADWKRDLVRVLAADAAAHPAAAPFALWDFSGYSTVTTEALPPSGDTSSRMHWYWESSHFKREAGDLVLDRLFDPAGRRFPVPADFGVQLTAATIEAELAQQEADGRGYRASHPADLAEIESAVAAIAARH